MTGSIVVTITGTPTTSTAVPINHRVAPVNLAWGASASGFVGTVAYSFDDPNDTRFSGGQYAASGLWFTTTTVTAGMTTFTGSIAFPIRAVKLSGSGAGANDTVTVTFVQAGITNG